MKKIYKNLIIFSWVIWILLIPSYAFWNSIKQDVKEKICNFPWIVKYINEDEKGNIITVFSDRIQDFEKINQQLKRGHWFWVNSGEYIFLKRYIENSRK